MHEDNAHLINKLYTEVEPVEQTEAKSSFEINNNDSINIQDTEEVIEESLSLEAKEVELIKKALEKYSGKRKHAAEELGISERTLYRKIKEYDIK